MRMTFCWLAEMNERRGEVCLVMEFLRGDCACVWKLRKAVCEALGACLSAFTTANGRLSINAMMVDGSEVCLWQWRSQKMAMKEVNALLYVTML